MLNANTINLIKIGNSKGFCVPSRILREMGAAETFEMNFRKEDGVLEIKPHESLVDKWIKSFEENGSDGSVERIPVMMLTATLKEDLQFKPEFSEENECQKTRKPRNRGKSSDSK